MISGKAKILEMDSHRVIFKYSIDETFPETVLITITRERWEKQAKEDTSLWLNIRYDHELIKEA